MSIPKIIHNIYINKNQELPALYKECQAALLNLHPDFEYRYYADEDMDAIMKREFPEYYSKFNELPRIIMKIDMFRYFLMYKYGGIYTDMDYLMFRPFDLLDYNVVLPCNRDDSNQSAELRHNVPLKRNILGDSVAISVSIPNTDSNGSVSQLGNSIFASIPGHAFWKLLMDTLFTVDRINYDYNKDDNISGNSMGTGPGFVTEMWNIYRKDNTDIHVPNRNLFHPPTNPKNIEALRNNSDCYGMHLCSGLWRNGLL